MAAYSLNALEFPGAIVVHIEGHADFLAENFHQAEQFAQMIRGEQPLLLPAPSDAEELIARVLARVAQEDNTNRQMIGHEVFQEPRAEGDTRHMYYLPSIP